MPAAALVPPPSPMSTPEAHGEAVASPDAQALGALLQLSRLTEAAGQAGELLHQVSIARQQQTLRQLVREAASQIEGVTSSFFWWDATSRSAWVTMTGTSREGDIYRHVARALVQLQTHFRTEAVVIEGGYVPDELPGEDALIVFRR